MANKHRKKKPEEFATTVSEVPVPETDYILHVMSNDPQAWKYDLMQMLMEGVMSNAVGYMDAQYEDGTVHRLLVGMEPGPNGEVNTYPLARLLDTEEIVKYRAPDGKGGWDERPEAVQ